MGFGALRCYPWKRWAGGARESQHQPLELGSDAQLHDPSKSWAGRAGAIPQVRLHGWRVRLPSPVAAAWLHSRLAEAFPVELQTEALGQITAWHWLDSSWEMLGSKLSPYRAPGRQGSCYCWQVEGSQHRCQRAAGGQGNRLSLPCPAAVLLLQRALGHAAAMCLLRVCLGGLPRPCCLCCCWAVPEVQLPADTLSPLGQVFPVVL